ncbi:hypothetical protein [Acidovorax sp. LjRoot117]|uniref:hypothetical protein n=1 Tax=Acidovorax sp. LjRoot117 TaxID=3342255 RepID=UPI003ECC8175
MKGEMRKFVHEIYSAEAFMADVEAVAAPSFIVQIQCLVQNNGRLVPQISASVGKPLRPLQRSPEMGDLQLIETP